MTSRSPCDHNRESGFSLLEVLLVLGIIGVIASLILPNLSFTPGSDASMSLREFTSHTRATYDSAVLTGRIHRIVIQPQKGVYWTEQAPLGFTGRPTSAVVDSLEASRLAEARDRLIEELETEANVERPAGEDRSYSSRSILVQQRRALRSVRWEEVRDPILTRRQLRGNVVFSSIFVANMTEKLEFQNLSAEDQDRTVSIYFFPWGEAMQAQLQLGRRNADGSLNEMGALYTIVIDAMTGKSQLLEGAQDAPFVRAGL